MDDLRGAQLGDYRLLRPLAEGGTASVWACVHQPTAQRYAIKVLAAALRDRSSSLARLMQEGRAIQSLRHDNIVRVFDHGVSADGIGWVVMELLDGLAIDQLIDRDGPFDPDRVVFVARQVCSGLAAAHARAIYHRDIKPANIMLVTDQRHPDFVKVLDFGVARLRAGDPDKLADTAQGMTLGTPQYMSPEQAQAHDIDGRSDLYQVGLLMWEMLVGEPPFDDPQPVVVMRQHLQDPPPPPRARRPDVSVELEAVILRCLAKRPEERYPTADALGEALDRIARRETGGVHPRAGFMGEEGDGPTTRLPSLGDPADLEDYAANVESVLKQLWPLTPPPAHLRALQAELDGLNAQVQAAEAAEHERLAARRANPSEPDGPDAAPGPLDGAIQTLEFERVALENDLQTAHAHVEAAVLETRRLDRDYAAIYRRIESNQRQLYGRAGPSPVDFGELFRENIDALLEALTQIFESRRAQASRLEQSQAKVAGLLARIADLRVQLLELQRSKLALEARRIGTATPREAETQARRQAFEALRRRREHCALELGIAFRHAVRQVIDIRDRGPGQRRG